MQIEDSFRRERASCTLFGFTRLVRRNPPESLFIF